MSESADNGTIVGRFEQVVSAHPERPAILTEGGEVSYERFNREVNRLAHAILRQTGGRPQCVALLFEQGYHSVLAMFGALKAGCPFVPLDRLSPAAKLRAICESAEAGLLVCDRESRVLALELAEGAIARIDLDELPADLPEANPAPQSDPDSLAFLFYTSGSTGEPKGVCQTHRNVRHFIRVYTEALQITADDRLVMLCSPAFSSGNMDIYGALLNGATLCPYDIHQRGTAPLADWLCDSAITILHTVPTVFRHLCSSLGEGRRFERIRVVDLGGETLFASDVDAFRRHFSPDCLLINRLASTEVWVIALQRIDSGSRFSGALPVGLAGEGVEIRVVTPEGDLAAPGQSGEIVIRSRYVSTGYWNQPELNARVFAADEADPSLRVYRSGDLGLLDDEGRLHYIGRADSRLKIRGYGVDPNEVEAAIRDCPGVRDAAVLARQLDANAPAQLAAFVIRDGSCEVRPQALREMLAASLAPYMIPSDILFLDSLPTNASGKIDRRTLAAMDLRESGEGASAQPPRGEQEQLLAGLFEQVLGRGGIGRNDDFFLIGGTSLQATELHHLLEAVVSMPIPMHILFRDATLHAMAAAVRHLLEQREQPSGEHDGCLLPLQTGGSKPPMFLIHGARGAAFVGPFFLEILGPDQPVYAFQMRGLRFGRRLSLRDMAAQYIAAMREIQPTGPYLVSSLCAGSVVAIEIAHQLRQQGEQVGPLLMMDPPVDPPGEFGLLQRIGRMIKLWKRGRSEAKQKKRQVMRMRVLSKSERMGVDARDQEALDDLFDLADEFMWAMLRHRITPFDGEVFILGSEARLSQGGGRFRSKLTGRVVIHDVAEKHSQIHVAGNERLRRHLTETMQVIDQRMGEMRVRA